MLDWDDLRYFLTVARHGSLTAAAKELRVAQSTVGRRLGSLESTLGARLLNRTPEGYVLTLAGLSVKDQAERVETEALSVERLVGGRDAKLEGTVRISSPETIAAHILAPCFAALQLQHPDILIELMPALNDVSLSRREADIAIRLSPADQHDLVVRKLGRIAFGLYASVDYLDRFGIPDFAAGCSGHRFMTVLHGVGTDAQATWLGSLAGRATVGFQTGSHEALFSATTAGGGLACLAVFRGDEAPRLQRLSAPTEAPCTDLWLAVHRDSRSLPRVRATIAAIVASIKARQALLDPATPEDT